MATRTVSPHDVHRLRHEGPAPEIIDVRTPSEYAEVHLEGARLVPLDRLDPQAVMSARSGSAQDPLYVVCRSGSRGAKACEKFEAAGFTNVLNIEGGTTAWEKAGLPVFRGETKVISLERQVRIGAGLMVLAGVLLGFLLHPAFYALAAFVGGGLVFAGVTDWCGMAMVLAKMPWNQAGQGRGGGACSR